MTDEEHDLWEALAVGHAMRALEPADDALFRDHLATCERCAQVLAESQALVGGLASAAEPLEPPPALRDRIVAISRDTGARVAPVVSRDQLSIRRARRVTPMVRWVAAAAVVGAIASSGVTYAVVHRSSSQDRAVAIDCFLDAACQHLPLQTDKGAVGSVVLEQGKVYVITPGLPKSGENDQYVFWTGDKSGKMRPVTAFRVTDGNAVHQLDKTPDMTGVAALAISREVRGPLPETPSAPLGIATVPASI